MKHSGAGKAPLLLIHGGVGTSYASEAVRVEVTKALDNIVRSTWNELSSGMAAVDAVCHAVEQLENSPLFNAGFGSTLQSDGMARLSASLMDGAQQTFSAVSLVTHIRNPVRLARALQSKVNRVLGPLGAQLLARELGLPPENPVSPERAQEWANSMGKTNHERFGTVGAVALDKQNRLAAATSTGGHGHAYPERISDVSSPAGNYSSNAAAISCSGVGEQIIDAGLAVRLESRIRDGLALEQASERCLNESEALNHRYGWIAVDRSANWSICFSTPRMSAAVMSFGEEPIVQLE